MYLEINNIAQGINIGIFVLVLSTPGFYDFQPEYYSTPLFALASLCISVIFWARFFGFHLAFAGAVWQLIVTHDYRRYQFIESGI